MYKKCYNLILTRKEFGLSQSDLANAVDVSQNTISNIENGIFRPSYDLALKIHRFMCDLCNFDSNDMNHFLYWFELR